MRNVHKIFIQLGFSDSMSLNDDSYERQPEHVHLCTMCFSGDIWAKQRCITHWDVYVARAINAQLCRKGSAYRTYRRWQIFVPC